MMVLRTVRTACPGGRFVSPTNNYIYLYSSHSMRGRNIALCGRYAAVEAHAATNFAVGNNQTNKHKSQKKYQALPLLL